MSELLHNPYIYIGLELLAIGILLRFIIPWSREFKKWKLAQEEAVGRQKEEELMDKLRNVKRGDQR